MTEQEQGRAEAPEYRVTEPSFFANFVRVRLKDASGELRNILDGATCGDVLLSTGDEIVTLAPPGAHMLPLNDAARAMVEQNPKARTKIDFFDRLRLTGGDPGDMVDAPEVEVGKPTPPKVPTPRKRRAKKRRVRARAQPRATAQPPLDPTTPTKGNA